MKEPENNQDQDRLLWRRVRRGSATRPTTPLDFNDLASYVDGNASPELAEAVEKRMLQDPALLNDIVALRRMAESDTEAAPAQVELAAREAFAPPARTKTAVGRIATLGVPQRLRAARQLWRSVRWAAAAAAVLAACSMGYLLGYNTSEYKEPAPQVAVQPVAPGADLIQDESMAILPERIQNLVSRSHDDE